MLLLRASKKKHCMSCRPASFTQPHPPGTETTLPIPTSQKRTLINQKDKNWVERERNNYQEYWNSTEKINKHVFQIVSTFEWWCYTETGKTNFNKLPNGNPEELWARIGDDVKWLTSYHVAKLQFVQVNWTCQLIIKGASTSAAS